MASSVTLNEDFVDNYGRYIVIGVACLLLLIRCCSNTETNPQKIETPTPAVRKWATHNNSTTQTILKTRMTPTKQ